MRNKNVALLGLGTVGTQLLIYIKKNRRYVQERYNMNISLQPVFVRDLQKKRAVDLSGLTLTNDPVKSIKEADIVIDCMGGNSLELTRELILSSLRDQRSVILSSKNVSRTTDKNSPVLRNKSGADLLYDATVGGCIPIHSALEYMGRCDKSNGSSGICNATSNYILEKWQRMYLMMMLLVCYGGWPGENDPRRRGRLGCCL